MGQAAVVIPEKIYFKIGEVCDLVGVQAHVLRYWESEFPQLSPQKNRSGQRSYRRRDVEISLRIKQLLYDEMFTIAGAKKKLQGELRETTKLKIVPPVDESVNGEPPEAARLFDDDFDAVESITPAAGAEAVALSSEAVEAIGSLASQLLELREMLRVKEPK